MVKKSNPSFDWQENWSLQNYIKNEKADTCYVEGQPKKIFNQFRREKVLLSSCLTLQLVNSLSLIRIEKDVPGKNLVSEPLF